MSTVCNQKKYSVKFKTVAVLGLSFFLVTIAIIIMSYYTSFGQYEKLLKIIADSRVRIVENLYATNSFSLEGEYHNELVDVYREVEIIMATKQEDKIKFLLHHKGEEHYTFSEDGDLDHSHHLTKPMQLALNGGSNVFIGTDQGREMVAAFGSTKIGDITIGVVASVETSEIRKPFFLIATGSFALMIFVTYLFSVTNLLPLFRLGEKAYRDSLTGLLSRWAFLDQLTRAMSAAKRHELHFCLFLIDLDRFKWVNDTFGHSAGDALLAEFARRLRVALRAEDIAARTGGDEFSVIVYCARKQAASIAKKILDAMAKEFVFNCNEMKIRCSIGICYTEGDIEIKTLLKNADTAMYVAKKRGREESGSPGLYEFFVTSMTAKEARDTYVTGLLSRAIEDESLEIHFQPKVGVDGGIAKCEALARLKEPGTSKYISPSEFIPVAEDNGLITYIGSLVRRKVCAQIKAWEGKRIEVEVSVNVSGRELEDPSFFENILKEIAKHGIDHRFLALEFTESCVITRVISEQLAMLKKLGIYTDLDDFGTDHSNLVAVESGIFRALKIDKAFVRGIESKGTVFIQALVGFAHRLGLNVVVEGVETRVQLALLRPMLHNVDLVQGYFCSRPVPLDEFEVLLERQDKIGTLECWLDK